MNHEQFAMTEQELWDDAVKHLLGPVMLGDTAERKARRRHEAHQLAAAALRMVEKIPL